MIHGARMVEVLGRNASLRIRSETKTLPKSRSPFSESDVGIEKHSSACTGMTKNMSIRSYFPLKSLLKIVPSAQKKTLGVLSFNLQSWR
jgi:hypothetical protein